MQSYSTGKKARPGTAASRMGRSHMGGSKMPASSPSAKGKSRGIDWAEIARLLPISKTDPD